MNQKNIIITGASRGIGYALCQDFLSAGHRVLAVSRNLSKLYPTAEKNRNLSLLEADLGKDDFQKKLNEALDEWPRVDVIYNNAGFFVKGEFSQLTEVEFAHAWKVNFLGPVRVIKSCLPKMQSGSHVVNISTMGAVQGSVKFGGLSAYSSSKAALTNLTELLAEEFAEKGISFNAIALGAVQTEMLAEAFPGLKAPVSAENMASWLMDFGLNGHKYFNGKILPASSSTP